MDRIVSRWWHRPGQFDWLSHYLRARGLERSARRLMALVCIALIFMPLGLVGVPTRSDVSVIVLSIVAFFAGIGYAVLWLRGWPTRIQSLHMVVVCGMVAVGSILAADPLTALVSCNGLVVIGGYLAFFHSSKAVVCSIGVAVATGGFSAVRVAEAGHGTHVAVAGFWVVVEVSAAVPLAVQTLMRTLGADVVRSDHDALTGVLNRRALYERATSLLTAPAGDLSLIVVMIDLDKFKQINDTFGHLAGDQILAAVGWALRQTSSGTAIIGRVGGEEFLVVDTLPGDDAERLPARFCDAVSALPHAVTASVGALVVPYVAATGPASAIDEMVHAADSAMYEAKSNGGDQAVILMRSTAL